MKSTKSKIIIVMCAVLCIMAVGYAAFSTALTITGTANIASEWKVVFTDITQVSKTSGVSIKSTPVASGTTATFSVGLTSPGDKVEYKITVENKGTIDAIIENIKATETGNEAIIFSISNIKIGDILEGKETTTFNVLIEYNSSITSQPENLTNSLTISIDYIQYVGQTITPSEPEIEVVQPLYLSNKILSDNIAYADNTSSPYVTTSTGIDFSAISSDTNGKGLYYTSTNTEGNQPTYYFRGAVDNNYVKMTLNTKNTCVYNNEYVSVTASSIIYGMSQSVKTEEECLSTNVCDLSFVPNLSSRYVVGIDEATCKQAFDSLMEAEYGVSNASLLMTCQYNGNPVVGIDQATGNFTMVGETECLTNNVCMIEYSGIPIGVLGLDEVNCLGMGGQWTNAKPNFYSASFPYLDDKATYGNNVVDVLWRIVRINEDGSVRMITQDHIGWEDFNDKGDNAYLGYMYGTPGSSTYEATHANTNDSLIKIYLDNWYTNNLSNYSNLLADAGFCNDRSIAPSSGLWASNDTALGYGKNITYYGSYNRLQNNKKPQFACPNASNDLFTTSTSSEGNKKLTYPIGLLTVDEAAFAGAVDGVSNASMYLNNGERWTTISPEQYQPTESEVMTKVFIVNSAGKIASDNVNWIDWIGFARPVISLKSTVEITGGDGTSGNPYIIK